MKQIDYKSLSSIILTVIVVLMMVIIWIVYRLGHPEKTSKSLEVKPAVDQMVQKSLQTYPNILGFELTQPDLVKNREYLVYSKFSDLSLHHDYRDIVQNRSSFLGPVFGEEFPQSNSAIVKILSGTFTCIPFSHSLESRYFISGASKVSTVCSVSVPPDTALVKGILTVFLRDEPKTYEVEILRMIVTDVATVIDKK